MPFQNSPKAALLAMKAVERGQKVKALGFSCAEPETILEALRGIKEAGLINRLADAGIRLSTHANLHASREAVHKKGFQVGDLKVMLHLWWNVSTYKLPFSVTICDQKVTKVIEPV